MSDQDLLMSDVHILKFHAGKTYIHVIIIIIIITIAIIIIIVIINFIIATLLLLLLLLFRYSRMVSV